ncbi:MAG: isopentenyl-diphosphate delta-isomerase [Microgenomates group bacterium Gr01-1014_80]|nr:MAG: isopentenyl-diphosphate delta-isomerase [Microgenomates group bacterium Gr01-1014_80]
MVEQIILGADENGNFTGEYFPKSVGHTGKGKRHLAITVLIFNGKGEVLLQKRKHKVFDNIWDMTASTHQLHREDGTDETDEEATLRALEVEYGIKEVALENLGGFNYFAKYGEYCENEHDKLLIGEYNGEVNLNPEVGYEYKWMPKEEFLKDIEENPDNYTPWAIACVPVLKKAGFFND